MHFRFTCISKTTGQSKTDENLGLGVSIQCIQGTFDSSVFKVIISSFGAFPIFDRIISVTSDTAFKPNLFISGK